MKPKVLHQQAMDFSFKAKLALEKGNLGEALQLYKEASEIESEVAEFYFDKLELEPTRSVIIRSAAYLNLKAGLFNRALNFISFGLNNLKDINIIEQLQNALELTISLKNLTPEQSLLEYNYLTILRQRSINYVIEPLNDYFGRSITLDIFAEFSENYLKSIRAFAIAQYKKIFNVDGELELTIRRVIDKLADPIITSSAYGSFKFSIANDYIPRPGEDQRIVKLKSDIVLKYHYEIFTNELSDEDIYLIKNEYTEEDINSIFRPLTKIKSTSANFKISYIDIDLLNRKYVSKIASKQKEKLLPIRTLNQEDIGELQNSIVHYRRAKDGKYTHKTIHKEQLKSYEFDHKIDSILAKNRSPVILNEPIFVNVNFNSEYGFTFTFDDMSISVINIEFSEGLSELNDKLFSRIIELKNKAIMTEIELRDWEIITKLVNNPNAIN